MALSMLAPNPILAFPRLQPPTRHCSRQGKSFSDSTSGLVVQCLFASKDEKPMDQLVTIDLLQRLGVSYDFEDEIKSILDCRYKNYDRNNMWKVENLYATAVEFRLLRQHGHNVPQDVFNCFKDEMGRFKPCHYEDIKGTLCLYEASYFSMEGESVLDEARDFTKKHLEKSLEQSIDKNLAILVSHSLELPLHWRMLRIEARWWKNIGLGEKMSFTRDRLVENFLWAVGHAFEPQFGYCRKIITKVLALIVTIDDIYDIYGTLDELEIFTDAVDRWDINAMDQLPEYMKISFLALFNSVNEMAYNVLKEEGSNIIPHLRKMWADLCKCYLVEARWYYSGYTPTLQEYITNGFISSSAPAILGHAYFSVSNPVMDAIEFLEKRPNIIHGSSMILRLSDDLGTSKVCQQPSSLSLKSFNENF
ncbi:(-)-alpha-terpineol synthase [Vitis vinifera]|uniref:(-)-alpha-terpineol synthase n=1 Tax=Vitis vinifera TaxID=29760 RepID=A0A438GG47_VITVI|nr:(-)-alpha-terpineol synthase [Vitis vinifera]